VKRYDVHCFDRRGPLAGKTGKVHHASWQHGSYLRDEADACAARISAMPSMEHIDVTVVPSRGES
jgi:hypothetical protein